MKLARYTCVSIFRNTSDSTVVNFQTLIMRGFLNLWWCQFKYQSESQLKEIGFKICLECLYFKDIWYMLFFIARTFPFIPIWYASIVAFIILKFLKIDMPYFNFQTRKIWFYNVSNGYNTYMNSCIFYFHNKFIRIDSFICLKKNLTKHNMKKSIYRILFVYYKICT